MSKKARVIFGIALMVLAYVCVYILGTLAIQGFLGKIGIPLVLTIAVVLLAAGAFQLIKAGVVCKPIRFLIYYVSGLAALALIIVWAGVLKGM